MNVSVSPASHFSGFEDEVTALPLYVAVAVVLLMFSVGALAVFAVLNVIAMTAPAAFVKPEHVTVLAVVLAVVEHVPYQFALSALPFHAVMSLDVMPAAAEALNTGSVSVGE